MPRHLLRDFKGSYRRMLRNSSRFHQPHVCRCRPTQKGWKDSGTAEPMRETPEDKDANSEGLPPSGNAAVSEAVWQKWLNKNKERDAVRRKKLIRLRWFILALVFVGAVGRWLTVSK